MRLPESSLLGLETPQQGVMSSWSRRIVIVVVVVAVAAGLAGLLGDRVVEKSASEGEWSVELTYPEVARAGLDVPWQVVVRRDGGFDDDIELAVTGTYFDIFETQGFNPEPSDSTRDGSTLYLTFKPPTSGETFVVRYDAYIQPASQVGRSGSVSVVDDGERTATVPFTTTLLP